MEIFPYYTTNVNFDIDLAPTFLYQAQYCWCSRLS